MKRREGMVRGRKGYAMMKEFGCDSMAQMLTAGVGIALRKKIRVRGTGKVQRAYS
jgi:hypothetical protein